MTLSLAAALAMTGCGSMGVPSTDIPEIPLREYDDRIEGSNAVIMADTPQELRYCIPDTGWQTSEMEAAEEVCDLFAIASSEGLEEQAAQFIQGEVDSLNLSAGEFVVVEVNGAHWLSSIEMQLSPNSSLEVSITDGAASKEFDTKLLTKTGTIDYEDRTLCNYIKIQCPDNAEMVQISELEVSGTPTLYEQVLRELSEDTVVMGPRDENNPLHIYRMSLNQSVYSLADRLLNGSQDLTNHEKIMVFMEFISEWYVGFDNAQHYLALGSYIESCGGYSNVLAALATTQGLEARIVNMYNYPQYSGHTVCEIYYDEAWHIYDPTNGAFYTDTPEDTKNPNVLSYEELSRGEGNSPDITCVVTTPDRLISEMSYGFLGPAIYEAGNPSGVIGPDQPMTFPLTINLLDDACITSNEYTTAYQGISYIGSANVNAQHSWTICGLESGKNYQFIVLADKIGGELFAPFEIAAESQSCQITTGKTHVFDSDDVNTMEWIIEFTAESETAELLLTHNYSGPDYHYIRIRSFEIKLID